MQTERTQDSFRFATLAQQQSRLHSRSSPAIKSRWELAADEVCFGGGEYEDRSMFESLWRAFAPRVSVASALPVRLLNKYGSSGVYTSAQVRRVVEGPEANGSIGPDGVRRCLLFR